MDDSSMIIRPQTFGMIDQRMEMLQRLNGTGSDGVQRHFESINSVSTADMSSLSPKNNGSFESEDFPVSSSSSESNNASTVVSEQSSTASVAALKEKKKRLLFGLVKKKIKSDKKHID